MRCNAVFLGMSFPGFNEERLALESAQCLCNGCNGHQWEICGFGVLELATLDLDDCEEIGHQVADGRLYLLVDTGSWGDAEASREIPWLQCIYATVDEAELASRCGGD